MNREDYVKEVQRQLDNDQYYEKVQTDFSPAAIQNVIKCVEEIENIEPNIRNEFDVFPENLRTPQFYILPKIHKTFDDNLPLGYPGRPIVSAYDSCTDHISKYVDHILQPFVQSLPSYIKDTNDFITKLKQHKLSNHKTFLVTLDVNSLYTNIPHTEGIEACKYFLENSNYNGRLSVDSVCKLIQTVLENNFFKFNNDNYLQKTGTAMGSPMAPSFASLFMDVDVSIDDEHNLSTNVHVKPTNIHQYVDYSSCHPKACKDGIHYSQAKRYRRICSDENQFFGNIEQLRQHFLVRNYPESVINTAFEKVMCMSQDDALRASVKQDQNIVPFVVEYNTSLPNIGNIINKYWDLLQLSDNPAVKMLHLCKPTMAFKRPKNLKDILVKTDFHMLPDVNFTSSKCNRSRCSHCSYITESDSFNSSQFFMPIIDESIHTLLYGFDFGIPF
ncbi:uncharacterized protein LOC128550001 [Mercenaria mercenaria]|uniref:uncharacterized protein LOC128550001 n=1 Tax=Mercenaria mercenaria TaxID=6596 RepID=UPI00234E8FE1|nr:uncharacterized protein LOC128550001 [Mercenaria mercenaria]